MRGVGPAGSASSTASLASRARAPPSPCSSSPAPPASSLRASAAAPRLSLPPLPESSAAAGETALSSLDLPPSSHARRPSRLERPASSACLRGALLGCGAGVARSRRMFLAGCSPHSDSTLLSQDVAPILQSLRSQSQVDWGRGFRGRKCLTTREVPLLLLLFSSGSSAGLEPLATSTRGGCEVVCHDVTERQRGDQGSGVWVLVLLCEPEDIR